MLPSSETIAPSGQQGADDLAHRVGRERTGRQVGADGRLDAWRRRRARRRRRPGRRARRPGRHRDPRARAPCSPPARGRWPCRGRRRTTRATWCPRGSGGGAPRAASPRTRRGTRAGRRAPDRRRARGGRGTSRRAAWRRWCWRCGWRRRARRPRQARPPTNSAAGSSPRRMAASVGDERRCRAAWRRSRAAGRGLGAVGPAHVGREDQRGHLPWRPDAAATASAASPGSALVLSEDRIQRRHVAGHRLDVGLELGVVLLVVGRVVADDVHDRRERLARRCAGWPGRCRAPARGGAAWPRAWSAMRA